MPDSNEQWVKEKLGWWVDNSTHEICDAAKAESRWSFAYINQIPSSLRLLKVILGAYKLCISLRAENVNLRNENSTWKVNAEFAKAELTSLRAELEEKDKKIAWLLCEHKHRRGGNDYVSCDDCGFEYDYRKEPDPHKAVLASLRTGEKKGDANGTE